MAVSCFEEVFEGRGIQSQPAAELENFQSLTPEACLRRMLYQDGVETSTPTKLYKKELFEGCVTPVGKLYEDIPVAYEVLKRQARVAWIGNVVTTIFSVLPVSRMRRSTEEAGRRGTLPCVLENVRRVTLSWNRRRSAATSARSATSCSRSGIRPMNRSASCSGRKWSAAAAQWCRDPNARKKQRLAALLSYGGYPLLRFVYDRTQWRGKTR